MITASVSLSPYVLAQTLADTEIKQHIAAKVTNEQIKAEAEMMTKLVTESNPIAKNRSANEHPEQRIDRRM